MDALEEQCNHLPGDYADECKGKYYLYYVLLNYILVSAIIEMYGPQLIKMVEASLAPDAICGALGLCDGHKKSLPSKCQETKVVGLCRALIMCK